MRRHKFNSLRRFEKLEDRRMMVGDIDLDDGVLTVEGTNNSDQIQFYYDANADEVVVTFSDRQTGQLLWEETYEREHVQELEVYGYNGDDILNNFTNIASKIYGGGDDDSLHGGSANDRLDGGAGNDKLNGKQGDDHLIGGVGDDRYSFSGTLLGSDVVDEGAAQDKDTLYFSLAGPVSIDLSSTAQQVVNPDHLTLRLTSATGIEDVHGTDYDDVIQGNSRDNTLRGYDGRDILYGRGGADFLSGGYGDDDLHGEAGNDTYEFYNLQFYDTRVGTDAVYEAANADTDTLDFSQLIHGVFINLATAYSASNPQYAVNFAGTQLKLSSTTGIENVIGTPFDDVITGNSRDNHLKGLGGYDNITGAGGNDTLEGGAGNDIYEFAGSNLGTDTIIEAAIADNDGLRFSGMLQGLTIDLTKSGSNYAVDSTALRLKLSNDTAIEKVWGTDYRDTIIGNSRDNYLVGRAGNDTITGGAGADYLHGGDDDDQLWTDALDQVYGGRGYDLFDYYFEGIPDGYAQANPKPGRYLDWRVF